MYLTPYTVGTTPAVCHTSYEESPPRTQFPHSKVNPFLLDFPSAAAEHFELLILQMKRQLEDQASSDSERESDAVLRTSRTETDGGHEPSTMPTSSAQRSKVSRALYSPMDANNQSSYSEEDMLNRYIRKLAGYVGSLEEAERTIELVNSLEGNKQHDEADAVLAPIIHSGMSQKGTRLLFHIGSGRFTRLRDGRAKKESNQPRNGQQITSEMLAYAKANAETWPYDETSTCIHRSKNRYVKSGVTWKELWQKYSEQCIIDNVRAMAYKTWMQYRLDLFPLVVVTTRNKEKQCTECKIAQDSVTG